jgi:uncharacterized membrane protein YhfC
MIVVPIVVGVVLRRRLGTTMAIWAIGAAAFVSSQIVHLPLNFALGLLGPPRGVALLPLWAVGAIAGLSAGLCEESARYVAMRWFLKKHRSWESAVQFGAGHGGIEAILFGVLALLALINVLIAPAASSLGLSLDDQAALRHAARLYWQAPWYHPVLAGYERLCAIGVHIGLSTLVMRGVARGQIGYLLLAILLHAMTNFPIVYMPQIGLLPIYVFLTLMAAALLGIAVWLRARFVN